MRHRGDTLRIGILGAARIAPSALLRPAKQVPEVEVVSVAARDPQRALEFARKHGIPRAAGSYTELLRDPGLEAVYIPLPNSLHCEWTIRALDAGKHVLCEKPLASNAAEAERMVECAARAGRVLAEAFHYFYHPVTGRVRDILASGEVGQIRHLESRFTAAQWRLNDIRYRLDLAGGSTMDLGCYSLHWIRSMAGAEPEVLEARAALIRRGVDRATTASLRFADGRTARMHCALLSPLPYRISGRIQAERGRLVVLNPFVPHLFHRIIVYAPSGTRHEKMAGESSYTCQLRAFARAVRGVEPMTTSGSDAIANMSLIDRIYEKAGLGRRGARV